MRVLVTGAYGYVGNAVVRRLAEAGHEVVALTRRATGAHEPRLPVSRVVRADIRDEQALTAALDGVHGVCHLAALTRVRESFERPEEYQAVNTGGTVALLTALATVSSGRYVPRFVLGSTAAVLGAPENQPITEDAIPAPTNPYGVSKLAAEEALLLAAETGTVTGVSLRCFNISGSVHGVGDMDATRIIPKALSVAAGHRPHLDLNGPGTAIRDFVHVADVAHAYLAALAATPRAPYRTYNVGATPASMHEIIETVRQLTGRPVPVIHHPPQPEPPRLVADTTRITTELRWTPTRSTLPHIITDAWSATPREPHPV